MLACVAKIHTDGNSLEWQHLVIEYLQAKLLVKLDQWTDSVVRHVLVIDIPIPERVEDVAEVMCLNNSDAVIGEQFLESGHHVFLVVDMRDGVIAKRDCGFAMLRSDPLRQPFAKKFAYGFDTAALRYRRDILCRLDIEDADTPELPQQDAVITANLDHKIVWFEESI